MILKYIKQYAALFRITFSISAFTFGGGYTVIPMIRKYFVDDLALMNEQELLDMAAIAQSTPGAIAVNIAVLAGYHIYGIAGAMISAIGTILPPLLILSIISVFYQSFRDNHVISAILKGMEAGIAAIIVDLVAAMSKAILKEKNMLLTLLAPATFIANFVFHVNVLIIIIFCSLLCFMQTFIKNRLGGMEND